MRPYSSPGIIRAMKVRGNGWAGYAGEQKCERDSSGKT